MVNLKELREKAGLTQQELADQCNVIRQTISNIECELSRPSVETAKLIAKVLDISWTDFFAD
jgi:putative transcriptional regulator